MGSEVEIGGDTVVEQIVADMVVIGAVLEGGAASKYVSAPLSTSSCIPLMLCSRTGPEWARLRLRQSRRTSQRPSSLRRGREAALRCGTARCRVRGRQEA